MDSLTEGSLFSKLSQCWRNDELEVADDLISKLSEYWQPKDQEEPELLSKLSDFWQVKNSTEIETPLICDTIFPCDQCEHEALTAEDLANHKTNKHEVLICKRDDLISPTTNEDNKRLVCQSCDYRTNNTVYMSAHNDRYHGPETDQSVAFVSCPSCEFETKDQAYMKVHIESKHNKTTRVRCNLCDFKSFRKQNVRAHQRTHHPNKNYKVVAINCPDCEANIEHRVCKYPKPANPPRRKRLSNVLSVKLKRYACEKCGECRISKKSVLMHIRKAHVNEDCRVIGVGCKLCAEKESHSICKFFESENVKEEDYGTELSEDAFACNNCPYQSPTRQKLISHHESVHQGIVKFKCSLCDMRSYYRASVVLHQEKTHRTLEKSIISIGCILCENNEDHKSCITKNMEPMQVKRIRIEKGKLPKWRNSLQVVCNLCNETMKTKGKLRKHYITNHKDQYLFRCDSCEYGSNWNANVKTHKESKHLNIVHTCDICGYTSMWNTQFLEHRREKHGLYQKRSKFNNEEDEDMLGSLCDQCGFSADNSKLLRIHKRQTHTYICDYCGYSAKASHILSYHLRTKHKKEK